MDFDRDFWQQHWDGAEAAVDPNPYLVRETAGLTAGSALEAGCGDGVEAIWLASQGWSVTAVDISAVALARASGRAGAGPVAWVEADLVTWQPDERFDLVTTHYAHPSIPQLEFYGRLADWVGPGGTLLIVGHLHDGHQPGAVALDAVVAGLGDAWRIDSAGEHVRSIGGHELHDVVVRAHRIGG